MMSKIAGGANYEVDNMTKLLDRAIARARALNEIEQDEAAELLLWAMGDPQTRSHNDAMAFNAGMEQARRVERSIGGTSQAFGKR